MTENSDFNNYFPVDVIIPAFNEQNSIGRVLNDIPWGEVRRVIVCDNNSSDQTAAIAKKNGAIVVREPRAGYGNACLKCMEYIANSQKPKPRIVVFLDADYSDYPEQMINLIEEIKSKGSDLIIGSRSLGTRESGSMTPQQIFGNWLATRLIKLIYNYKFTDLGPFRAIKYEKLLELDMSDKTYGWTVEMQVKAVRKGMKCAEIPVNYRRRIGYSKVSGTLKGTIGAGWKIIYTIFKYM